ncbi:MAG: UDP-N-acetylglucosamine 2-epimerase (non-hydrolyzing) [Acidimicrobiales bacterium]|jgi:UDP-N-acetylglucosamine 2-epimerase (non-hydrolysing)
MRPLIVFGTRPNFVKVAPIYRVMSARADCDPILVHTGQHFDASMSDDVIKALDLPQADVRLEVGIGTQAWQIATIMARLEAVYESTKPDCTVVVGDVSSTLAAALVSDTLGVPVAHIEAGLRSFNWAMPEERNRVLTDRMSRWLFAPSEDAVENLRAERIAPGSIHMVGNVMIDSLDWVLPRLDVDDICRRYGVAGKAFGVVTLHRASNVDDPAVLARLGEALVAVSAELPLLFAVHPRTQRHLRLSGAKFGTGITMLPPVNYADFVGLMSAADLVLTDSGGIQEEAVVLGVPCLTLREETERPSTLDGGRNEVVGTEPARITAAARSRLAARATASRLTAGAFRPPLWDGHAAERITAILTGVPA